MYFRTRASCIVVSLVILCFSACTRQDGPVLGLWSGKFKAQLSNGVPSRLEIKGDASCWILRHKNAGMELHLSGSFSGGPIQLQIAKEKISIPVKRGKFDRSIVLSPEELGDSSWLELSFSQPGLILETLNVRETREFPKTVVFALDGATWRVAANLVERGLLPHFKKLMESGSYGVLESVENSLSPVVWTTIATGRLPDEHGIHDFIDNDDVPVNSDQIRTKRVWEILSEQSNLTLGVCGWYVTWPVEQISGFMVSDRANHARSMSEDEQKLLYYPSPLRFYFEDFRSKKLKTYYNELERFTSFKHEPNFRRRLKPTFEAREMNNLFRRRMVNAYLRDSVLAESGLFFYKALQPDVFFIYFRGNDYTQHAYWHAMSPEESLVKPTEQEKLYFSRVIENYYIYLDEVIGEYMKGASPQTSYLVISDHGFQALPIVDKTGQRLTGGHDKEGIYIFSGKGFVRKGKTEPLSILDICPLLLHHLGLPVGRDMKGVVPLQVVDARERNVRFTATYGPRNTRSNQSIQTGADEEIREQLRTLGYIN